MDIRGMARSLAAATAIASVALPAFATDYYWIGGASGDWANGANWSLTEGGAVAGAYPNSGVNSKSPYATDSVFFLNDAVIGIAGIAYATSITATGATVTFTGGGSIRTAYNNNSGKLQLLGDGTFRMNGIQLVIPYSTQKIDIAIIETPIVVVGVGNSFRFSAGTGRWSQMTLSSSNRISGSGELEFSAGMFNQSILAFGDVDLSEFTGTMTLNAKASALPIDGGGTYVLGSDTVASSLATITFRGVGGTLAFADGVAADMSGKITGSTAAVAVDTGDANLVWASEIAASNEGGFTKRGAGTLVLSSVPRYSGTTTVEEGVFLVPGGTVIENLSVSDGAKLAISGEDGETVTVTATESGTDFYTDVVASAGLSLSWSGNTATIGRSPMTFTWTGAKGTDWFDGGNWSVGGEMSFVSPGLNDTAFFPESDAPDFDCWIVELSSDVYVTNVVVDGDMKFSGGQIHTGNVGGRGTITLNGNAGFHTYDMENVNLEVTNNIVVAGTGNRFQTQGSNSYMNGGSIDVLGDVSGDGEITTVGKRSRVRFHGDWSGFTGTVNAQDDGVPRHALRLMAAQASSSNAVYNIWMSNESAGNSAFVDTSSNSYTTDDRYHYCFGALNGRITIYQKYNNTFEIGALNQDCAFTGNIAATHRNHIKKVGTATLTFSGSGLGRLEVAGGVFSSATESAIPAEGITFSGKGGFFDPTTNAVDFASKLVNSTTAPIGLLITNDVTLGQIPNSNRGGLVKKGEGTLTLAAIPQYSGVTKVEAGELIVPEGTVLDVCFSSGTLTGAAVHDVTFDSERPFTVGSDAAIVATGTADISNLVIYIANPAERAVHRVLFARGGMTGTPTLRFPEGTSDELKSRWSVDFTPGNRVTVRSMTPGFGLLLK